MIRAGSVVAQRRISDGVAEGGRFPGAVPGPALRPVRLAVSIVLVAGAPAVAAGSDAPSNALAAVAPAAESDSHLILRLPPADSRPGAVPSARRAAPRDGLAAMPAVIPGDFALRLLDPEGMVSPPQLTPSSSQPDTSPELPASPPSASAPSTGPSPVPTTSAPSPRREEPTSHPARSPSGQAGERPPVTTGRDPIKMVTIPLGQSRRWTLDHEATAVFAATPEIADVRLLSPDLLYVIGRGVGRTSVAVLDDRGLLDEWLVTTVLDLEPVHAVLAGDPALSGVRVQHFSRGVTLTGAVASVAVAERARRLVAAALPENAILENEIEVEAPQQVNLEVQIAEVQRSVTETLGVSWEAINRVGEGVLAWQIGRPQGTEWYSIDPTLTTGFVEGQPTSSVAARYLGSRGGVQGVVDALATAGLANVLARPNLTAISGETASFFSGGEYPLPVGFRDGVIVFEYKKYGVLLDFVPTVVDPDRITLTVRPEVSETSDVQSLVTVGTEIPVINVRRAETTVELGNGESIVIAGLFRSGSNTVESGLPGLKDIPVFGLLFRQDRVEASETELIVVVTANLVRSGAVRSARAANPAPATRRIHGYHY